MSKVSFISRFACYLLICIFSSSVFANDALDVFLKDLRSLNGEFEQKQFSEQGKLLESSSGVMYIQRPNRFRWDYQKPFTQLIVGDSKQVWVYDQDLEQVTIKSIDKALGNTPAFLLSDSNKIDDEFSIYSATYGDDGTANIELIPKNEEAQFAKIYLVLKEQTLLKLELKDNLGQTTVISFTSFQRNQSLDPALFTFTPPKGVDVVKDL